jgi:N-glycosylase/DNA lyase
VTETLLRVTDYDLAATLSSGQAFRWTPSNGGWEGVIGDRWVRLTQIGNGIRARTTVPCPDWAWLETYLQADVDLAKVIASFPDDPPMRAAVNACRGLRLLRQDPWECLASFILSSTKQIIQIQQIVKAVCECYGDPIPGTGYNTFPSAARLALLSEANLRSCKMGFRAPYLLGTARIVSSGQLDLEWLRGMNTATARDALTGLPGVGEKIANCVLLFAYGFQDAFPVDVWVQRALMQLYFPKRKPTQKRLLHFIQTHFGPNAGYAQQYFFHYMRMHSKGSIVV